jgi:predicted transposase YdaD
MPREDVGMTQDYDPTLKALVETEPESWLPVVDRPLAPVTVEDADLATLVSGAVDKVLRVHADPPYLVHLDFQAGHDSARLPPRLRLYNTVLDYRHDLPVLSVAVLLHPEADSRQLTGRVERALEGERPHAFLGYKVVRVWRLPVERLLAGGLGTLPLAPISNVRPEELPRVVQRMQERLRREERARVADLWAATHVLLGLRYEEEFIRLLLQGVIGMKESVTYQAIVAEGLAEGRALGAVEEAQKALLLAGRKPFGEPDEATSAAIHSIHDLPRLEQMIARLFEVRSWQELLGQPAPRRRRRSGR